MQHVSFIRMDEGTAEDYAFLNALEDKFVVALPDRLLAALPALRARLPVIRSIGLNIHCNLRRVPRLMGLISS